MLADFIDMLQANEYLILDTETTGLREGEIVQIAIQTQNGVTLLDTLIRPSQPIPADATRIHGITDEMVAEAPLWSDVVPQIEAYTQGAELVVYNAIYDRRMMHQTAARAGLPHFVWKEHARWWCAMHAFAEWYGDWNEYHQSYRWQTLSKAAAVLGIEQDGAHTALSDVITTRKVCAALIAEWRAGRKSIPYVD